MCKIDFFFFNLHIYDSNISYIRLYLDSREKVKAHCSVIQFYIRSLLYESRWSKCDLIESESNTFISSIEIETTSSFVDSFRNKIKTDFNDQPEKSPVGIPIPGQR